MEQLNSILPKQEEDKIATEEISMDQNSKSPLLIQVRKNFGVFGGISLIFGGVFTLFFYKAGIGFNVLLFSIVMVSLLVITMKKLNLSINKLTLVYYLGAILLGTSTMLTSNGTIQFLNIIGILLLLNLSMINQFNDSKHWGVFDYIGKMFVILFKSILSIGMPWIDCSRYLKNTRLFKNDRFRNIMIGIVIAIPLLWVVMALLSSADQLFSSLTKSIYEVLFSSDIFMIGIIVLFGFLVCYGVICGAAAQTRREKSLNEDKAAADPAIAITAMLILCFVYVMFSGIQMIYLFANGLFVLPQEFTFAEYARRGFFELLAVSVINIILMLVCTTIFGESKLLRIILTVISICTYIMIASAAFRMLLYIGAYHLTFLRLFVLWFLLVDAMILAGVIISMYNRKFPLFHFCVVVISICYLIFSFSKPDYFIARYYIGHKELLNEDDITFLTKDLSYDAAPAVLPVIFETEPQFINKSGETEKYEDWAYDGMKNYYINIILCENERGMRDFNLSHYLSYRYALRYPVEYLDLN